MHGEPLRETVPSQTLTRGASGWAGAHRVSVWFSGREASEGRRLLLGLFDFAVVTQVALVELGAQLVKNINELLLLLVGEHGE